MEFRCSALINFSGPYIFCIDLVGEKTQVSGGGPPSYHFNGWVLTLGSLEMVRGEDVGGGVTPGTFNVRHGGFQPGHGWGARWDEGKVVEETGDRDQEEEEDENGIEE